MKFQRFEKDIIFENKDLIAVNKPSMISSLQDRIGVQPSIQDMALDYCDTSQLCHRLDKETSGVLLIAKNPETYREVAMAFEHRNIQKTYWAISDGRHYFQNITVDIPLSVSSRGKAKVDKNGGKDAETHFKVIENFKHFSLVECKPITGRLHQIRIHLATQNAPISGDLVYGGASPFLKFIKRQFNVTAEKELRPMISRAALHARAIALNLFGEELYIEAEPPKDFSVFLKLLRKYDAE